MLYSVQNHFGEVHGTWTIGEPEIPVAACVARLTNELEDTAVTAINADRFPPDNPQDRIIFGIDILQGDAEILKKIYAALGKLPLNPPLPAIESIDV